MKIDKFWLAKHERKLPGARSGRAMRRARKTPRDLRRTAVEKVRSFCAAIPKSDVVGEATSRLSVGQRAYYQRIGMWT